MSARTRPARRMIGRLAVLCLVTLAVPAPAAAQQTAGSAVRAEFLKDLAPLSRKFVALAGAFPAEKYDWRPGPGVRSVREVLSVIILENGTLVPRAFGRAPLDGMTAIPDTLRPDQLPAARAAIVDMLRRSFELVDATWTGTPADQLSTPRQFFGQTMSAERIAFVTLADQHEHLGQLIAYARVNGIVPPWSRKPTP